MKTIIILFFLVSNAISGESCYLSNYDLKLDFIKKCSESIYLYPNYYRVSVSSNNKISAVAGSCSKKEDKNLEYITFIDSSGARKIEYSRKSIELVFPNCYQKKKHRELYTYNEKRYVYRYSEKVDEIGFYMEGHYTLENVKSLINDKIQFEEFTKSDFNYLGKVKIKEYKIRPQESFMLEDFLKKKDRCKVAKYKGLTFVGCGGMRPLPGPSHILVMDNLNFVHIINPPANENVKMYPLVSFKYKNVEYIAFKSRETGGVGVSLIGKYKGQYFSLGYLSEKCDFDNQINNGYCETLIPKN